MARAKTNFLTLAERSRAWRAAHPERAKAIAAKSRATHAEATNLRRRTKYAANPEPQKASSRRYGAEHAEEKRLASQAWRQANPERSRASVKAYRKAKPEIRQVAHARRRARKRTAAINDLTAAQWQEIKAAYDFRCVYCERKMKRLTQDHITPLAKGGNHTASNIVPACQTCNTKKGTGAPLNPVQPLLVTVAPACTKKAS